MAPARMSMLFGLAISFACISLFEASYVPVLFLGSDSEHVPDDPTSAVHKLTDSEFREDFLRTLLDKGPVVCITQDTLSLEDFSMLGNAYGKRTNKKPSPFANLEKRLDKMPSLLLPAVNMQPTTLTSADNPKWNVVDVKDSSKSLKDSGIQVTGNNLIVIHVPPTKNEPDRLKALQMSDEILEKFAKELEDAGVKFTLIYTANKPSWTVDQEDSSRISRNLLSVADDKDAGCALHDAYNNTLLYFTSLSIKNDSNPVSINCSHFDFSSSSLSNEYVVTLEKNTPGALTVKFTFKQDRGYWLLTQAYVDSKVENGTGEASLSVSGIWAPVGFSYTCQDLSFSPNVSDPDIKKKFQLRLENFQIQPFNPNSTARFGDPMDCVGFFTIPIWMSIFVTVLLLAILGFGIQMLMSINTMDRFDDPKGKTISVANAD